MRTGLGSKSKSTLALKVTASEGYPQRRLRQSHSTTITRVTVPRESVTNTHLVSDRPLPHQRT